MKNLSIKPFISGSFLLMAFCIALVVSDFLLNLGYLKENTALGAVALNTLAEKELIKHFRHEDSWLQEVPDKNEWVNNDVIKLTEVGADPTVLINNNTYPIAVSQRVDDSVAVSLYKFETTNTEVKDDEIYALPYDKPGSVQEQHRETLEERTAEMGLHSLAPLEDTVDTPVLESTGPDDGNGRKRLIRKDLITFRQKLDDLKVPKKGRVLVLCSEHVSDLLIEDSALQMQYHNVKDGVIATNYYGFKVYESVHSPSYNEDGEKKAFGAASSPTDRKASVAFFAPRTAKARGSVKRYMSPSDTDPLNRRTLVGFRLYHLVIPTKKQASSAIISGIAE